MTCETVFRNHLTGSQLPLVSILSVRLRRPVWLPFSEGLKLEVSYDTKDKITREDSEGKQGVLSLTGLGTHVHDASFSKVGVSS